MNARKLLSFALAAAAGVILMASSAPAQKLSLIHI